MSEEPRADERRFRIVGICQDGERVIFADGLDIVEAYARRRAFLLQKSLPRIVIEVERPLTLKDADP
jgi:hypothetical protein